MAQNYVKIPTFAGLSPIIKRYQKHQLNKQINLSVGGKEITDITRDETWKILHAPRGIEDIELVKNNRDCPLFVMITLHEAFEHEGASIKTYSWIVPFMKKNYIYPSNLGLSTESQFTDIRISIGKLSQKARKQLLKTFSEKELLSDTRAISDFLCEHNGRLYDTYRFTLVKDENQELPVYSQLSDIPQEFLNLKFSIFLNLHKHELDSANQNSPYSLLHNQLGDLETLGDLLRYPNNLYTLRMSGAIMNPKRYKILHNVLYTHYHIHLMNIRQCTDILSTK